MLHLLWIFFLFTYLFMFLFLPTQLFRGLFTTSLHHKHWICCFSFISLFWGCGGDWCSLSLLFGTDSDVPFIHSWPTLLSASNLQLPSQHFSSLYISSFAYNPYVRPVCLKVKQTKRVVFYVLQWSNAILILNISLHSFSGFEAWHAYKLLMV